LAARLNHQVQATAADIFKTALLTLDRHMPPEWRIVALIHDAVVVEVPEKIHLDHRK